LLSQFGLELDIDLSLVQYLISFEYVASLGPVAGLGPPDRRLKLLAQNLYLRIVARNQERLFAFEITADLLNFRIEGLLKLLSLLLESHSLHVVLCLLGRPQFEDLSL